MEKTTKEVSLYEDEINLIFYSKSHRYKIKGKKDWLISATSATGIINKPFLIIWATRLAGDYLKDYVSGLEFEPFPTITKDELIAKIEEAIRQHEIKKKEAADIGSQVHEWAEAFAFAKIMNIALPPLKADEFKKWAIDNNFQAEEDIEAVALDSGNYDERIIAGINAFLDWHNNNQVEFLDIERCVYSRKYDYCGIFDAVAKINGKLCLIDYKTSKGVYPEFFLQSSAYLKADEEESGREYAGIKILHFDKLSGQFSEHDRELSEVSKDFQAFLGLLETKKWLKNFDAS